MPNYHFIVSEGWIIENCYTYITQTRFLCAIKNVILPSEISSEGTRNKGKKWRNYNIRGREIIWLQSLLLYCLLKKKNPYTVFTEVYILTGKLFNYKFYAQDIR